jgi:recombination protein RecA
MHGQAALLKREIEAKLANRIPAALSPIAQQAPRLHPIGNARFDNLLGGGLPLGSVCELTGPDGSGRSSLALSLLASASKGGACAYIDVNDTLSPQSAAAAGIELANLLWVRFAASTHPQMGSRQKTDNKAR